MNYSLSLQVPEPEHLPSLARLCRQTFAEAYRVTLPKEELEQYLRDTFSERRLAAEIRDPAMLYRILVDDGNMVRAYIKFQQSEAPEWINMANAIELQRFYVDLEVMGRGIGGRLLEQGEQLVRQQGHDGIWLKVWDGNQQAQRIYARRGYQVRGEVMYPVGQVERRVLVMARSFGPSAVKR
jgi:GNAT superfamily N-acetyltransferase